MPSTASRAVGSSTKSPSSAPSSPTGPDSDTGSEPTRNSSTTRSSVRPAASASSSGRGARPWLCSSMVVISRRRSSSSLARDGSLTVERLAAMPREMNWRIHHTA